MCLIPANLSQRLSASDLIAQLNTKQSFVLLEYQYLKEDAYKAIIAHTPIVIFLGFFGYLLLTCAIYITGNHDLANSLLKLPLPYLAITIISTALYARYQLQRVANQSVVFDSPNKVLIHHINKTKGYKCIKTPFDQLILVSRVDDGGELTPNQLTMRIGARPAQIKPLKIAPYFGFEVYRGNINTTLANMKNLVDAFTQHGIAFLDLS
jgi:hypothetical protein